MKIPDQTLIFPHWPSKILDSISVSHLYLTFPVGQKMDSYKEYNFDNNIFWSSLDRNCQPFKLCQRSKHITLVWKLAYEMVDLEIWVVFSFSATQYAQTIILLSFFQSESCLQTMLITRMRLILYIAFKSNDISESPDSLTHSLTHSSCDLRNSAS